MITKKKTFKLETTGSLLNYTITSDSSCMSITPSSGEDVASGTTIEFTFELQDESCFSSQIVLSVEDSEGCDVDTYGFTLENDCNIVSVLTNQPSVNNPYVFLLSVTGAGNYTTTWNYDTAVFGELATTNNSLELLLTSSDQLINSEISATVVDTNNCTSTVKYDYIFCSPTANDVVANLTCFSEMEIDSVTYKSGRTNIPLYVTACAGKTVDYDALVFSYDTSKLFVEQSTSDTSQLKVYAKSNTTPGDYDITYKVKDSDGLFSNEATLQVRVPLCTITSFPTIPPATTELGPGDVPTTKIPLGLDDLVFSKEEINWDAFTFVANTGQTLVDPTTLTTSNGGAIFKGATREIEYTVGAQTENVDLVEYKLADTNSTPATRGLWYINYESQTAPVGVTDSYTVAKNSITELAVLDNDGGDINVNSIELVTLPTKGTLSANGDGSYNYLAGDVEGADSFTYKYYDVNRLESNTVTVNITIDNAGTGSTQTICKSASVDLTSYLTGTIGAGGTWTQDVANPVALVITVPTSVDFTTATPGNYNFTYTVGSDSATITLIIADNGFTLLLLSVSGGAILSWTYNIEIIGISNTTDIYMEMDYNSGANISLFYPSTFSPLTNSAVITGDFDQGSGSYDVTIRAVDVCGVSHASSTITHVIP